MTNLEKYLNNATRGIWGKRKLEIREELEGHILENARKYEIAGFTPDQAVTKVLEQLGNPRKLSFGFWEVYMVMQRQFMLGSLMVVTLLSVATWQMTLQRNFKFSCASLNKLIQLETQANSSLLNQFSMVRNLENLDFNIFMAKNIKTIVSQSAQYVVTQLEASEIHFQTKTQIPIELNKLKMTTQTSSSVSPQALHCSIQSF